MSRFSFVHGVVVAAVLAPAAAVVFAALSVLWPGTFVIKLVITLLGGAYFAVIVVRAKLRFGRIALPLAWLLAAGIIAITATGLASFLVAHAVLLWLSRSLCCHTSVLSALFDLGLAALALIAASATALHSGSVLLSVWCFFLVQALFCFIPQHWQRCPSDTIDDPAAGFTRAARRAEAAFLELNRNH